jgi:hypothetical protein
MRHAYNVEKSERCNLKELGISGRVPLKWILKE